MQSPSQKALFRYNFWLKWKFFIPFEFTKIQKSCFRNEGMYLCLCELVFFFKLFENFQNDDYLIINSFILKINKMTEPISLKFWWNTVKI